MLRRAKSSGDFRGVRRILAGRAAADQTLSNTAEGIQRLWQVSTQLLESPPPVRLSPPDSVGAEVDPPVDRAACLAAAVRAGLAQAEPAGGLNKLSNPNGRESGCLGCLMVGFTAVKPRVWQSSDDPLLPVRTSNGQPQSWHCRPCAMGLEPAAAGRIPATTPALTQRSRVTPEGSLDRHRFAAALCEEGCAGLARQPSPRDGFGTTRAPDFQGPLEFARQVSDCPMGRLMKSMQIPSDANALFTLLVGKAYARPALATEVRGDVDMPEIRVRDIECSRGV